MARFPRVVVPGHPLHVIQRGNNRQAIFFADRDCCHFHNDLREASQRFDCVIHAYVYMTNHVHLLVTPSSRQGISRMMQSIGRRYVRYVNSIYGRSGTLWEGRFKPAERQAVYSGLFKEVLEEKFLQTLRKGTNDCAIVGSEKFQTEIAAMLARRVKKYEHGGDRRSERYKV